MAEAPSTTTAHDGRTVAYAVWGDPTGFPVLSLHGTPGCRLDRWPNEDVYRELGVRFVTHDRAGYGRSERHPGRSVADEAADVAVDRRRARSRAVRGVGRLGWRPARTRVCRTSPRSRDARHLSRRHRALRLARPRARRLAGGHGPRERQGVRLGRGRGGGPRARARARAGRDGGAGRRGSVDAPRRLRPERIGPGAAPAPRARGGLPRVGRRSRLRLECGAGSTTTSRS